MDHTRWHGSGREEALLLRLVGGVVLHLADEAARQVTQFLQQAIVDITPLDDAEAAGLHGGAWCSLIRPIPIRDRRSAGPLALHRKSHMHLGRPMLVFLPQYPSHPRQGG